MKKSVYSLMLFDEIVDEIDKIASEENLNRSQIINDILAEHLGLITPEQKIQRILDNLNKTIGKELSVKSCIKNSSIRFGKNIDYKYKPIINYTYEFIGPVDNKFAVLKISSRSKSTELNNLFEEFFNCLSNLEQRNSFHIGIKPEKKSKHKFIREFRLEGCIKRDLNEVTDFLINYLLMLDEALEVFFSLQGEDFDEELQKIFNQFFESNQLQVVNENPLDLIRVKLC